MCNIYLVIISVNTSNVILTWLLGHQTRNLGRNISSLDLATIDMYKFTFGGGINDDVEVDKEDESCTGRVGRDGRTKAGLAATVGLMTVGPPTPGPGRGTWVVEAGPRPSLPTWDMAGGTTPSMVSSLVARECCR